MADESFETSGVGVTHVNVAGKLYPISSLAEASHMFRAALARWPGSYDDVQFPRLCTGDGVEVGYVSSDGRCWIGNPSTGDAVCVYMPDD